jgi:hypothetical protein
MENTAASLISATVTVSIALIFVRAAWHKLAAFTEFTGFVADYRLFGERWTKPVSAAIVGAEILTVALPLVPGMQSAGLALAGCLFAVYAVAMGINISRGRTLIECGCGGAGQPLSWALIVRNGLLAALAGTALILGPSVLDTAGTLTAIGCGVALWSMFLLSEQVLTNSSAARLTR